jgi:aspartate/methionine/tyrosine aminotransferase
MGRLPVQEDVKLALNGEYGSLDEPYDWRFCRKLALDYGVIGIPASPFFSADSKVAQELGPLARFAFCKQDETLLQASNRLKAKAKSASDILTIKVTAPVAPPR